MSSEKSSGSSAGIGLFGGVFLVFLILKLAEIGVVADWSWWWVTAPLWIPGILVAVLLIIWLIILIVRKSKRKKKSQFIDRLKEAHRIQEQQRRKNL